jgi:hypothetical protein
MMRLVANGKPREVAAEPTALLNRMPRPTEAQVRQILDDTSASAGAAVE